MESPNLSGTSYEVVAFKSALNYETYVLGEFLRLKKSFKQTKPKQYKDDQKRPTYRFIPKLITLHT